MRELKFRCKIKGDAGVYGVLAIDWLHLRVVAERACGIEAVKMEKIQALLQYIGIDDKNGAEIYEGDLVKWGKWIFVVRWNEAKAGYEFYSPEDDRPKQDGWNVGDESEIVGNIYKTPKLRSHDA